MNKLLDAEIIFSLSEEQLERAREPDARVWFNNDVAIGYSNVLELFHGLQNVQNLYLSPDTLEVLSLCCEPMPGFNNLKSLAVKSDKDRRWQAMPVLLRNCPHLETLVIEEMEIFIEENDPTQLTKPEVGKLILEMFELYNKLWSCIVQLLVSDSLNKKWTAQGI